MAETVTIRSMRLVNPRGTDLASGEFHLNARLSDLTGKRLGLLENSKDNSGKLLRELGEILSQKYQFSEIKHYSKHSASLPTKPETIQQLLDKVDVLITGIGD